MPPSPEIGKPNGGVGIQKVLRQHKAQTSSHPNGAGRISGKIKKDLSRKSQNTHPCVKCRKTSCCLKNVIGRFRQHGIGQNHFHKQSQSHQKQTLNELFLRCFTRCFKLRNQLRWAHNRTGHQMRKKGNEQRKIEQGLYRLAFLFIHVNGIAKRGKRVKRYTGRQNNVRLGRMKIASQSIDQRNKIVE